MKHKNLKKSMKKRNKLDGHLTNLIALIIYHNMILMISSFSLKGVFR